MSYIKTHFRIRSYYQSGGNWTPDEAKAFEKESKSLFSSSGWTVFEGRSSGVCSTARRGKEELYLHPMDFSGVIQEISIGEVERMLEVAKTFQCYHVDTYDIYHEMSDEEYLLHLREKQDEMQQDMLRLYETKRRNLFITSNEKIRETIKKKYRLHRLGEGYDDPIFDGVFSNAFDMLVAKGKLIKANTKYGQGFRTATVKDKASNVREATA